MPDRSGRRAVARAGHPQQPERGRHVPAEQGDGPAVAERRRHRAGRLVRLRHRGRGRGGGRLGETQQVDPGPWPVRRQPCQRPPHVGAAGVAVHDDHRVRARARRGGRVVVVGEAAQQFVGAGRGLLPVVGEEQPAVLAVSRAQMRQPAQPGPLLGALRRRAGGIRGDQHDLQGVGGVQRGELGEHRAGQPGEALARAGQPQRADLAQTHGHGDDGQQTGAVRRGPVRRAEPHRQRLRVVRPALPQPGAGAERGQQQGGRVRPGLGP
ncbi:hypothetical protein LRR80_06753 [Streptomyces sp. RO-S4]|nr:hypothetical protein [Streptomyces sp. RO-S4]